MCGLVVSVENEQITKIRGDGQHALSLGYSCPKGRALGELHHDERRLNAPLVRVASQLRQQSWDTVLDDLAERLSGCVADYGTDSVAMYLASGSAFDTAGRRSAERFLTRLGSRQKYTATTIDTPSKPLVAELVGGWSGLTPVWDEASSRLFVLFGSNPIVSHGHSNAMPDPIRRIREFQSRGGELWVVDPRRTETAAIADHHIACAPGSDWLLLGWLVRRLLAVHPAAATLAQRATGWEVLESIVSNFTDSFVLDHCEVRITQLESLLQKILECGRVSALTGTGVSMSVTANLTEYLLWALHIVTDSYDQPGGMWFNPGYLSQLDLRSLPRSDGQAEPGPRSRPELPRRFGEYPCAALVPEIEAGNIKALIVVGGNPMTAFPDVDRTRHAFRQLSTLAVIDIFPTETTELASHVLPAVDQLERADLTWLLDSYQLAVAAQFTPAVVEPLEERKPVWWMFNSLAERMGSEFVPGHQPPDEQSDITLLSPLIARSRDGIALTTTPTLSVASGPVFGWITQSVLPEGGWRLSASPLVQQFTRQLEELRSSRGSHIVLIPRRRLRMMNSQFSNLESVDSDQPVGSVQASPTLVETLGFPTHVTLSTPSGSLRAPLVSDSTLRDGCVTLSHGWGDANVGNLTSLDQNIDPLSGMVLQSGINVVVEPS